MPCRRCDFAEIYLYDPLSSETRKVGVKGFENADLGGPDMFELGAYCK
jgi:hypothetical protein